MRTKVARAVMSASLIGGLMPALAGGSAASAGTVEGPPNNGLLVAESIEVLMQIEPDGSDHREFGTTYSRQPAWSPDGTQIAYVVRDFQQESPEPQIYVANADGSDPVPIPGAIGRNPAWSPDGTRIAFDRDFDIWVMDADGGNQRQLTTERFNEAPAWSPDGTKLVYHSEEFGFGDPDLFVLDVTAPNPQATATEIVGGETQDHQADWSPDGTEIAFTRNGSIWTVAPDGSDLMQIPGVGFARDPAWSPDGTQIAFTGDLNAVHVMNADGSDIRDLGWSGSDVDWQPLPPCTVTGTAGPDVLEGTNGDDVLCGLGDDDRLRSSGGDDLYLGGEGRDTVSYGPSIVGVVANLSHHWPADERDNFLLVENLNGSRHDDVLIGKDNVNLLRGGDGEDEIDGGRGDDQIRGGLGIDTIVFTSALSRVTVDLESEHASSGDWDSGFSGIENVRGSAEGDSISGTDAGEVLDGGGGSDFIEPHGGDDVVIGRDGAGVGYASSPGPVEVNLTAESAVGDGTDVIDDVSGATGSEFDDLLIAGHDTTGLGGLGGDDYLQTAGNGTETHLSGGAGDDTVDFSNERGPIGASLQDDVFSREPSMFQHGLVDVEHLIGSEQDDVFVGSDAANTLSGGEGADGLKGGAGPDALDGGEGVDVLVGGTEEDSLLGGLGSDLLNGGLDNDSIDGGMDPDVVFFQLWAGPVVVNLLEDFSSGQGVDSLVSVSNAIGTARGDRIRGDAMANRLSGGPGDDWINGRKGADNLHGNEGDDVLRGRDEVSGNDRLRGDAGEDDCRADAGDLIAGCE